MRRKNLITREQSQLLSHKPLTPVLHMKKHQRLIKTKENQGSKIRLIERKL